MNNYFKLLKFTTQNFYYVYFCSLVRVAVSKLSKRFLLHLKKIEYSTALIKALLKLPTQDGNELLRRDRTSKHFFTITPSSTVRNANVKRKEFKCREKRSG